MYPLCQADQKFVWQKTLPVSCPTILLRGIPIHHDSVHTAIAHRVEKTRAGHQDDSLHREVFDLLFQRRRSYRLLHKWHFQQAYQWPGNQVPMYVSADHEWRWAAWPERWYRLYPL